MRRLKVLLTGATGSLGRTLLDVFLDEKTSPIEVVALTRGPHDLPPHERVHYVSCDLQDEKRTSQVLERERPDWILHAAVLGVRPPRPTLRDLVEFNVNVSLRLFEQAGRVPGCQFLYASSGLAYRDQGRPLRESDPLETRHGYGASKAAADSLLQAAALEAKRPLTIVRPFSFSGPHERPGGLIYGLLQAAVGRTPMTLTSGLQVRDYCSAADVAEGMASCLTHQREDLIEIWNLGSGRETPLRALLAELCETLHLEVELHWGQKPLPAGEPAHLVGDCSRARQYLGWHPRRNLAASVWELARRRFPFLQLPRPRSDYHAPNI